MQYQLDNVKPLSGSTAGRPIRIAETSVNIATATVLHTGNGSLGAQRTDRYDEVRLVATNRHTTEDVTLFVTVGPATGADNGQSLAVTIGPGETVELPTLRLFDDSVVTGYCTAASALPKVVSVTGDSSLWKWGN